MKRFLLSLLIFFVTGNLKTANAQLLQWNTFGNAGTETLEPSVSNDPNIAATNLTQGSITPAVNADRFGGSSWWNAGNSTNSTLAEAIVGNDYIEFIVTPNAGYSFTATSFVFVWDRSGTGPSDVTLRSSADGFAADLGTVTGIVDGAFATNTITISGLTNITTATTFRLYGYNGTAIAGTGGFDIASNVVNVQLNGSTAPSSSNTITTGAVTAPPFVLLTCATPMAGTVGFTYTGTFNASNIFTAQLSDDIGSFASPTAIGTLPFSGTDPGGLLIPIIIPAGTPGGTGYLIRVVANDPPAIGSSSSPFTITQLGTGGCASSHTDYYRSFQTGDWATVTTWESSPNNINWIPATLTPTYLANDISIISPHTVTISTSVTVDEVGIDFGSILEHTAGTLTIEEGDINIGSGGIFALASNANPPVFVSGTATIQVPTFGILRVSATGLTGTALGNVHSSNYVYYHASVLEYTLTSPFSSSLITFFPNVNATTIPIFRTTNTGSISVGASGANTTVINGVFDCQGAGVIWQGSATKTFRNGIIGSGHVDGQNGTTPSGKFIINGATAELGGTGSLVLPTGVALEIGTPTTVTMTSDKTITGNVSLLTNTYVELGNYNLTVSGTVSNATITSYVKTNGTGKLTLNNVAVGFGGGKLFPIGLTTINPLFISSLTTANYSARIVEPITPVIYNSNEAVLRTWYISTPANTPNATISFGYSFPGDCGPAYNNAGPVEVAVNVGVWNIHQTNLTPVNFPLVLGTFVVTPTIPINYFNGTATEFPFVVANNGAVLISNCIITTRAQKRNNTGIISWTVNSCAEVSSFEVQRSVGNGGYQTMSIIRPTINETDFNFTDPALAKGTNLYRIKVNGINGSSKYSNTVALIYDSDDVLITSIAPNPVHGTAKLTLSAAKQGLADFKVYNITGSLVKQWHSGFAEGNNTIEMNVTELPAGIYQVLVSTANSKTVTRFVKQ